jgi:hypothetical protein
LRASAERARALLGDTVATLGNERPESRRQFADLVEFPIQRFPRLTTPFIADPETLGGSGRPSTSAWFVPFVLDRDQLGDVAAEHLAGELTFWLVPHGADVTQAVWREIGDCLVREPGRPGEPVALAAGPPELSALVFELPTRSADPDTRIAPGFYDLKVLPVLNALREFRVETPALAAFEQGLRRGDWPAARQAVAALQPEILAPPSAIGDLRRIASAIERSPSPWSVIAHPVPNFEDDLRFVQEAIERLAARLEKGSRDAVELRLLQLEVALRRLLESPRSLAPVALEDPAEDRERCGGRACVRIAVGGDFQYHGDSSGVLRFLGALDPSLLPGPADSPGVSSPVAVPPAARVVVLVILSGDVS